MREEEKMDGSTLETQPPSADVGPKPTPSESEYRECPFDARLARVPYLVIPKMALQAMPMEWRERFEALLVEADDTGLETPDYHVFRRGLPYTTTENSDSEDDYSPIQELFVLRGDPWADYRHATHEHVLALCPTFVGVGGAPRPLAPVDEAQRMPPTPPTPVDGAQ
jgi:hypothetical protein